VNHAFKAVCVVHNETSTGATLQIEEVREAIESACHPTLFLVDTVSGLGCVDYRRDEWSVDVSVSGSQKGLMPPPGDSFNAVSEKALGVLRKAKTPKLFWSWEEMIPHKANGFFPTRPRQSFSKAPAPWRGAEARCFGLETRNDTLDPCRKVFRSDH
jgi:alanine-glyoxylate transaminase/serine-glyoxylate transaminase/serine-pyruvate transaminase